MDSCSQSMVRQHCRRVAAVAIEVGRSLGIAGGQLAVLEKAALLHHSYDFGTEALARLAAEVCAARGVWEPEAAEVCPAEVAAVLTLVRQARATGEPDARTLAAIIRMSNALDEQIEALSYEHKPYERILEELREIGIFEGFEPELVARIEKMRSHECDGNPGARLPVQAKVAREIFQRFGSGCEWCAKELEAVTARDPVVAGALMKVANSAVYSPQSRLATLRQAITYIGTEAARDVVLACAIRPLFASAGLLRHWSHSLHLAQLASAMAGQTGILEPQSAMLLGLVHDVGALAVQMVRGSEADLYQRLIEKGCPATYSEMLLFGRDHGELGAGILEDWNFPEELVEAVRYHHQPERSGKAATALLFLAEFWSGMDEDIPSAVRIDACVRRTGVTLESLAQMRGKKHTLTILRSVA